MAKKLTEVLGKKKVAEKTSGFPEGVPVFSPTISENGLALITGTVRTSFMYTIRPQADQKGVMKYSVVSLFPKMGLSLMNHPARVALMKVGNNVCDDKGLMGKARSLALKTLADLFKDGDERDYAGFPGHYYLKATEKAERRKPDLRANYQQPGSTNLAIAEAEMQYSGSYWRFRYGVYLYDASSMGGAKNGLTCSLTSGQFLAHGENLSGGASADDDFDATRDSDDYDEDDENFE